MWYLKWRHVFQHCQVPVLVPEQPEVPNEVHNLLNPIIGFEISRSRKLGIISVCLVFGHWVRWNATKESGSKVKFTTRQKITFYNCLLTLLKHCYGDRTVCRITASRKASKHFRTAKFSALWMLWASVSRAAPIHWRAFGRIPVLAYNCACSYTFLIIITQRSATMA